MQNEEKYKATEVINWTGYDPNNPLLGAKKTDRESVTYYYCSCPDQCEAYAKGKCVLCFWTAGCPNGYRRKQLGSTGRAKSCGSLVRSATEQYPGKRNSLQCPFIPFRCGDFVYINLPYLAPFWEDRCEGVEIFDDHFVRASDFMPEFIVRLVQRVPRSYGGEPIIGDYQTQKLPMFCQQLKRLMPDLYEAAKEIYPEIEEIAKRADYRGRQAKIKTLLPGKVKFGTNYWDWDGEKLTAPAKSVLFLYDGLSKETVEIVPSKDAFAVIADNATVTEETEFI